MRTISAPDQVNKAAWSDRRTLQWFGRYEGWSDPGEMSAIASIASESTGQPILDIGVGAGRTTPILRRISDDYIAVDFAEGMVEICREKYPDARVQFGDARDLSSFADDSFGLVVFSWNGIDAVDHQDRQAVLSEVRRVLRPGGIFLFSTHNKSGPGHGEKPWTIRPNDFVHLRHLAEVIAYFPRNLRHYLQHRDMASDHGDWSMMNAAAHNFGLVIHYTTLEYQLQELAAAGFAPDPVVFESRRGRRVTPTSDTSRSWWFHVVARNPRD